MLHWLDMETISRTKSRITRANAMVRSAFTSAYVPRLILCSMVCSQRSPLRQRRRLLAIECLLRHHRRGLYYRCIRRSSSRRPKCEAILQRLLHRERQRLVNRRARHRQASLILRRNDQRRRPTVTIPIRLNPKLRPAGVGYASFHCTRYRSLSHRARHTCQHAQSG